MNTYLIFDNKTNDPPSSPELRPWKVEMEFHLDIAS